LSRNVYHGWFGLRSQKMGVVFCVIWVGVESVGGLFVLGQGFDLVDQDGEGGFGHAVAVALEFVEGGLLVAGYFHHAHHVGVFFVATQHFEFAVSGDQDQWGGVGSNVVEWGHFIDDGLFAWYAPFFADGEVGDGVTAEGDQARYVVRVYSEWFEPLFVQSHHGRQVASCGVA